MKRKSATNSKISHRLSQAFDKAVISMPPRQVDEEQPLIADALFKESSYQAADCREDVLESPPSTTATEGGKKRITPHHVLLLVVAVLYGSLNVTLRGVYALPDPPSASALSTIRGWLAVVCFAPFLMGQANKTEEEASSISNINSNASWTLWKVAAELAVWNFGAQGLANIGLLYIQSARAAFFTQLSVVMTPCLAALSGHKVQSNVWWACGFALTGLVFMSKKESDDNDSTGPNFSLGVGDMFCLCGALSWSTYLFRLSAVGKDYDEIQLQAVKTFLMAILYSSWCGVEFLVTGGTNPWVGWTTLVAWALLFYSALGPGTVADVLQQKGQSTVSATVANIILSLEPVFTALFGRILLREMTQGMEKVGGCLILTAAVVATMRE